VKSYRPQEVQISKGGEIGRFLLGSTAIILFGPGMVQWQMDLSQGPGVRMGQQLGSLSNSP
jgi:phosphatidylserine decarboxylase